MNHLITEFDESTFQTRLDIIDWESFPISSYLICEAEENTNPLYKKIWESILSFLKKMKQTIRDAIDIVSKKVRRTLESKQTKDNLASLRTELRRMEKSGAKNIEFYDVWRYQEVMDRSIKELDRMTEMYLKKYNVIGAGITETNLFTKQVTKTIEKYELQLRGIREKKIMVPIKTVLGWIEIQMHKGNKNIFSFAENYVNQLDNYEKIVKEYEAKADAYAEKTGMVRKPSGFTDTLKNLSIYVKRNSDWLGAMVVAAVATVGKYLADAVATNNETNAMEDREPSRGDSMMPNLNPEGRKSIVKNSVENGTVFDKKSKKYIRGKRALTAVQAASVAKATEALTNSVFVDHRNSV